MRAKQAQRQRRGQASDEPLPCVRRRQPGERQVLQGLWRASGRAAGDTGGRGRLPWMRPREPSGHRVLHRLRFPPCCLFVGVGHERPATATATASTASTADFGQGAAAGGRAVGGAVAAASRVSAPWYSGNRHAGVGHGLRHGPRDSRSHTSPGHEGRTRAGERGLVARHGRGCLLVVCKARSGRGGRRGTTTRRACFGDIGAGCLGNRGGAGRRC